MFSFVMLSVVSDNNFFPLLLGYAVVEFFRNALFSSVTFSVILTHFSSLLLSFGAESLLIDLLNYFLILYLSSKQIKNQIYKYDISKDNNL
jgi:hypothetical protein